MLKQIITSGVTAVAVALLTVALFLTGTTGGDQSQAFSGLVNSLSPSFQGLSVEGQTKVKEFTEGGGILTVSTTGAFATTTMAQLRDNNVISIADTAGSAALSLVLPTVTQLREVFPDNGDSRTWFIDNLHSAAATTTTVIAGTGIDLQGDTANDDVINGGVLGTLTCFKRNSTTIACTVSEKVVAD